MPESVTDVRLTVVVAAHDAAGLLPAQLDALTTQTSRERYEVVVVDNRSVDATADLVRDYARRHDYVRLESARAKASPGYARNVGAATARAPLLAFCDADDVVDEHWITGMLAALDDDPFVAGSIDVDRLNADWIVDSRGRSFVGGLAMYEDTFPIASSCNLGIRRELFERAGGFDEDLTTGEDIALSLALWLDGVALAYAPDAIVYYRFRDSLGALFRQSVAYGRQRPLTAEKLRGAGRRPPRQLAGLRNWAWLVRHAPLLARSKAGRARWLWVAGQRVGNLRGSWDARRLYL